MIETLRKEVRKIEDSFYLITQNREKKEKTLKELKERQDNILKDMEITTKSIDFVEQVATEERRGMKNEVESLITSCLHEVFDETYSVEFEYGMKRSKTSVEVYLIRRCEDGLLVKRKINGMGGGVADSISLPLKLIVLLNDSALEKTFVIDEPGKHLDAASVPKFAKFLKRISEKLKVQIIMSSHHDCMEKFADCVNRIVLEGSKSYIEREK